MQLPNNPALVIIDLINELVHLDGKLSEPMQSYLRTHNTLKKANLAITWARDHKTPVIHVKVGFSKNYPECPKQSPVFSKAPEYGALQLNHWSTEFHEDVDVSPNDIVVIKHRISAFYGTDLNTILSALGINHLLLCGVSTNMAVELTAREAHDRDFKVTVIEDACGTSSDEHHKASLMNIERVAQIITTDTLTES